MLPRNGTWFLGLVLVAQASTLSVSELLANAERLNGQPVIVSGTMDNLRSNRRHRSGPIYTFDLSDGTATILVTAFTEPPCQSGAAVVEGLFESVKKQVKASYTWQEITARKVTCLPDTVDQRGSKGK